MQVVDFGNVIQSFPNYYVLGPNIQWMAAHGVKGVFEEGPGVGPGDVRTYGPSLLDSRGTNAPDRNMPA